MKPTINQAKRKRAFTIIELLTVMSIIVILIGLLVPALNKVKRYAMDVKERAQLHAMDAAIELFSTENGGYPTSNALDSDGAEYCGAMKLCEALMGQDLLGFHSNSIFRRNGLDVNGNQLYLTTTGAVLNSELRAARKGPYLQAENANAWRMKDIYGTNVGSFLGTSFVLCDVYAQQTQSGEKTGMPILYYKADTANTMHDPNLAMTVDNNGGNIYNYYDNQRLVDLGRPWMGANSPSSAHGMADPRRFYRNTRSDKISTTSRPFRPDEFILISAGWDSEYGTADDICNYEWKYSERL